MTGSRMKNKKAAGTPACQGLDSFVFMLTMLREQNTILLFSPYTANHKKRN
jgi:hypothetical protein